MIIGMLQVCSMRLQQIWVKADGLRVSATSQDPRSLLHIIVFYILPQSFKTLAVNIVKL